MIITVLCGLGEYPVELPDDLTVNDLPNLIENAGGIVVPYTESDQLANLFIPASQIQGITWFVVGAAVEPVDAADLADVTYIEKGFDGAEELIEAPVVGTNGEVFIDS